MHVRAKTLRHKYGIFIFVSVILSELVTIPIDLFLSNILDKYHLFIAQSIISVVCLTFIALPLIYFLIINPLIKNTNALWNIANKDNLTKIFNRRYFRHLLIYEISRAKRHNRPLSIILFDIDNFKNINDTYGHNSGDIYLQQICKIITSRLRKFCTFCRYGGEEFIILIPEASIIDTRVIAEQIKLLVKNSYILIQPDIRINTTVSMGIVQFDSEIDSTIDSLINRADIALYKAKSTGKDKIMEAE